MYQLKTRFARKICSTSADYKLCSTPSVISTEKNGGGGTFTEPRKRLCTAVPLLLQQGCVLQLLVNYVLLVLCCWPAAGADNILVLLLHIFTDLLVAYNSIYSTANNHLVCDF